MVALNISADLADKIQTEATTHGMTVEEYLRAAIKHERALAARKKIEREQTWWLSQPESKRATYKGEFVAIHDLSVVDHDKEEAALYKRVRQKYGKTSVLVIPADGVKEIQIYSPRVAR